MLNKLWRVGFVWIVLLVLLTSCAQTQYRFKYSVPVNAGTEVIEWPLPPERVRYRYLGDITGESNFVKVKNSTGILRQSANWLGDLVFGESSPMALRRPQNGVVDNINQRIYVTDVGQKAVIVFDLKSGRVETWEGIDASLSFKTPIGLSLIDNNQILISDADVAIVARFDRDGNFINKVGEGKLIRPTGIAYDPSRKIIYVADSQTHQIQLFTFDGKWLSTMGGKGAQNSKFNAPTYLSFINDKLYVSDTLNARIQIFSGDGKWLRSFGKRGLNMGDMPRPKGVAIDSDNNIYVVESYYNYLLMFNQLGQGLMVIGGTGRDPGQFDLPAGVWVDSDDKIYVADILNQRISVFQYLPEKKKDKSS